MTASGPQRSSTRSAFACRELRNVQITVFGSVRLDSWPEHLAPFLGLLAMSSPKSGKSASTVTPRSQAVPSDSAAFYLSPTACATAVGDMRTPASDNGATSCDRTATINTACDHTA